VARFTARHSTPTGPGGRSSRWRCVTSIAYSYSVDPAAVHRAAALRAEAMQVSDRWVEGGCDPEDPRLAQERRLLVRSYAGLLAAVHR
jgi:hypothetical protein